MGFDVTMVDSQGQIYLKKSIREKAGIKTDSVVEIFVEEGQIIIRPKKLISEKMRGVFRLRREYENIKDVDSLISAVSIKELRRKLE